MPRLPPALEPLFPLAKRTHRFGARRVGALTRAWAGARPGPRSLPRSAYLSSRETAEAEPGAVFHPGGPAEHRHRAMPLGNPPDHWYWEGLRDARFRERFTLELPDGMVVGDYSAHLTASGALDFETSHYYDIEGWREHPIFLRSRLPEAQHVPGTLLSLATRGTAVNYYHYLMDALQRWGTFTESMPGVRPDYVLANRNTRFARELLELAGLGDVEVIEPAKHSAFRADRLLVPCLTNTEYLAPPWTTGFLRDLLPVGTTAGRPKRLYVTRGDQPNTRRVNNEAEVLGLLERHGFVRFDPGQQPVQDQIDTFAAAEVVVGPHGAALTNLNFSPPGLRLLELFAPRYLNPGYWAISDNVPDVRYRYLVGKPDDTRPAGAPMNRVYEDITVDLGELETAVEELLA